MQSLFDVSTYNEMVKRVNALSPSHIPRWGKMNPAQMLAHCRESFRVPLSDKKMPRMFLGILIGGFIKSALYSEKPWKKNLPTSPQLMIKDDRDFNEEKEKLLEAIDRFHLRGPAYISKHPHPFFGSFTPEQWGKSMFKHLDHHLRQFGV